MRINFLLFPCITINVTTTWYANRVHNTIQKVGKERGRWLNLCECVHNSFETWNDLYLLFGDSRHESLGHKWRKFRQVLLGQGGGRSNVINQIIGHEICQNRNNSCASYADKSFVLASDVDVVHVNDDGFVRVGDQVQPANLVTASARLEVVDALFQSDLYAFWKYKLRNFQKFVNLSFYKKFLKNG